MAAPAAKVTPPVKPTPSVRGNAKITPSVEPTSSVRPNPRSFGELGEAAAAAEPKKPGSLLARARSWLAASVDEEELDGPEDRIAVDPTHDDVRKCLALVPEEEGKAAKRFTVNFFSTDGQYDKEKAAAKQPKKKMRPNPLDKARARAARS